MFIHSNSVPSFEFYVASFIRKTEKNNQMQIQKKKNWRKNTERQVSQVHSIILFSQACEDIQPLTV